MNTGKVILLSLAGVAIGATIGILLAPDKGSSTRKKILKKSKASGKGLEKEFNKFIDGITKKYESIKDEVSKKAEDSFAKVEEAVDKAAQKVK